jgi:pyruvate-formate lyase-activating enzyme
LAGLYREAGAEQVERLAPAAAGSVACFPRDLAFLHLVETGDFSAEKLLAWTDGLPCPVGLPFLPNLSFAQMERVVSGLESRGTPVLCVHPPLYASSFQRLSHLVATGMAGRVLALEVGLPGGAARLTDELRSGDRETPSSILVAWLATLARGEVRWEAALARGEPLDSGAQIAVVSSARGTLPVRVRDLDHEAAELLVVGEGSRIALRLEEQGHTIRARRGGVERELASFPGPDMLCDTVLAVRRYVARQLRHVVDGRSGLLVKGALESLSQSLAPQPGTGGPIRVVVSDDAGGPRLDVYQKLPLPEKEGEAVAPFWEAKFNIERTCNQDCIFCYARDGSAFLSELTCSPDVVDGLVAQGVTGVMFSGGEPTLNPLLPAYIAQAQGAGVATITVESNALLFSDRGLVERCVAAGLQAVFVSFHSCRAEIVDRLSRTPGSFERSLAGIRNLLAAGVRVHANCVTNRLNMDHLEETVRFVAAELPRVKGMTLSFVAALGRATNRPDIVPKISEAAPAMAAALLAGEALGLPILVPGRCGIPLCFLPGLERFFVEYRLRGFLETKGPRVLEDRVKLDDCAQCPSDASCQGLWPNYAAMYGVDELRAQGLLMADGRGER